MESVLIRKEVKKLKIKSISYLISSGEMKIVVLTKRATFEAKLICGENTYIDLFNDEEPYDRKSHVFRFAADTIAENTEFIFSAKRHKHSFFIHSKKFRLSDAKLYSEKELLSAYDNGLEAVKNEDSRICDGVTYSHILYEDKNGAPVHVFATEVIPRYASIYVGTPSDGYESVKVRATIPDMVEAARNNGKNIVAAVNADYFDIFGDFHPSGLCVKNGKVIANPESKRNFIATLNDGSHIITNLTESPDILKRTVQAAAGLQMIVKDGKISDYAPLEPFSFTRHPRTAAGIKKDGTVILTVVDGRIPDYSNGASLVDLAKIMISLGSQRAINLDGGGSSAMYTAKGGRLVLHSRPADLFRPKARLIRKDYNSLLVEAHAER